MSTLRTAPAIVATRPAVRPHGAGTIAALGGRIGHAVGRRADRLRTALLVFSMFLPAVLIILFGRRG